jgi:hypothetical protein
MMGRGVRWAFFSPAFVSTHFLLPALTLGAGGASQLGALDGLGVLHAARPESQWGGPGAVRPGLEM